MPLSLHACKTGVRLTESDLTDCNWTLTQHNFLPTMTNRWRLLVALRVGSYNVGIGLLGTYTHACTCNKWKITSLCFPHTLVVGTNGTDGPNGTKLK